jgi:hypothetical protein
MHTPEGNLADGNRMGMSDAKKRKKESRTFPGPCPSHTHTQHPSTHRPSTIELRSIRKMSQIGLIIRLVLAACRGGMIRLFCIVGWSWGLLLELELEHRSHNKKKAVFYEYKA